MCQYLCKLTLHMSTTLVLIDTLLNRCPFFLFYNEDLEAQVIAITGQVRMLAWVRLEPRFMQAQNCAFITMVRKWSHFSLATHCKGPSGDTQMGGPKKRIIIIIIIIISGITLVRNNKILLWKKLQKRVWITFLVKYGFKKRLSLKWKC